MNNFNSTVLRYELQLAGVIFIIVFSISIVVPLLVAEVDAADKPIEIFKDAVEMNQPLECPK